MSSSDSAISPVEAQKLLQNAVVADPGVIIEGKLEQIMVEMKNYIQGMGPQGFIRKAMVEKLSPQYNWAHTTAPGIIWLWAQQDGDTQANWLRTQKSSWVNFYFKEPSPDSPIRWPSVSPSPSASGASAAGVNRGLSVSIAPPERTVPFVLPAYPPLSFSGGYRKRRTRKTRRKSSRRGKSQSRSRSHQIRRKKTHHRRHRR